MTEQRAEGQRTSAAIENEGRAAQAARAADAWALLRVWHLEAMETVIEHPAVAHFVRTSYVSVPAGWRELPLAEIARRVEQLLNAHYRVRAATLRTPDCDERMQPFAFDFEWVEREGTPAQPDAYAEPWLFLVTRANPRLVELAFDDLDARRQAARAGIAARCYDEAFEAVRVDADDTWHLVKWRDRAAMFAARHEGP